MLLQSSKPWCLGRFAGLLAGDFKNTCVSPMVQPCASGLQPWKLLPIFISRETPCWRGKVTSRLLDTHLVHDASDILQSLHLKKNTETSPSDPCDTDSHQIPYSSLQNASLGYATFAYPDSQRKKRCEKHPGLLLSPGSPSNMFFPICICCVIWKCNYRSHTSRHLKVRFIRHIVFLNWLPMRHGGFHFLLKPGDNPMLPQPKDMCDIFLDHIRSKRWYTSCTHMIIYDTYIESTSKYLIS